MEARVAKRERGFGRRHEGRNRPPRVCRAWCDYARPRRVPQPDGRPRQPKANRTRAHPHPLLRIPSHWLTNERDLGAARSSGRERCRAKSCTGRCVTAQTLGLVHGRAIALYTSPADTARPGTESTAAAESLVEGNAVHDDGHSAATCHMFKSTTMMAGVCE